MSAHKPLPPDLERPKVVAFSEEEIEANRQGYRQAVASFALEGDMVDDFGAVVAMEEIRGELTEEQARRILYDLEPQESQRIREKILRMQALGLTWKDL